MTAETHRPDGWDYALLLGGIVGVFLGLTGAVGLAGVALAGLIRGNHEAALAGEWSASAAMTMALLCLPAISHGGRSVFGLTVGLKGKPDKRWLYLTLLFPPAIGAGYLAHEKGIVEGLLGPVSHILAAGLPVLAAVVILRRVGPELPERRAWGQFLAGLWLTPAGALTLELLTLIPAAAALVIGLRSSFDFNALSDLLIRPDPLRATEYDSFLRGLILQPWVIVVILGYVALVVPIVEEGLKSIAVWPFLKRGLTSAEAFLSGTLAGAGYALFEALFLTQPGQGWVETMLARVGATFVHVLTAGISSWGLVEGFRYRRWTRCVLAAFTAIVLHGMWNAGAVGIGLSAVAEQVGIAGAASRIWPVVRNAGAAILAVIGGVALIAPVVVARRLAQAESQPVSETPANPLEGPRVPP
ncbi:MAG TPA: PrsW family glutamic-type intramembrane protease [Anaerolineales bacterium]|nr:PrsW family glutamic-type intramembrane protease [Anaerolineales bacterium]